jgi:phosphoglycerate dehydrogenase-like enzyme
MKPLVVVLDDFENASTRYAPQNSWAVLKDHVDVKIYTEPLRGPALVQALKDAHIVVLVRDRTPFLSELINKLSNLRYVIFTGARNNLLDAKLLKERLIPVSSTETGPSKEATAELTIGLLLACYKRLDRHLQTAGTSIVDSWRPGPEFILPRLIHGSTLGLVGLGGIGSKVCSIALAMGMKVNAWSPNLTPQRAQSVGAKAVSFETLLTDSDAISLHLVLSAATRGLFGAREFAQMKQGSVFINTSRSGLVDESALINALNSQHLRAAGIDVFDTEPVPAQYPLTNANNFISTPHLGFVCEDSMQQFWSGVTQAIKVWLTVRDLSYQEQIVQLPRPYLD